MNATKRMVDEMIREAQARLAKVEALPDGCPWKRGDVLRLRTRIEVLTEERKWCPESV